MAIGFLSLPYELREQIYGYLFQREEGPTKPTDDKYYFRLSKGRTFHERLRVYLLPGTDGNDFDLFSTLPIGQVDRQTREDVSKGRVEQQGSKLSSF